MQRWHIKIVTSVLLLCLVAGPTLGQFTSGLQGVLEDASGGGIPNATVKLRNVSTGIVAEAKTDDSGGYHFRSLAPGRYELSADAPGFQSTPATVTVYTEQVATFNLRLNVAGVSSQVSVSAETDTIDTGDSRLESTVRTQQLQDLPIEGRDCQRRTWRRAGQFFNRKDCRCQRKWTQLQRQPIYRRRSEYHK